MVLRRKLATWHRLSKSEKELTLAAIMVHAVTYACIYLAGLKAWKRTLGRLSPSSLVLEPEVAVAMARGALVRAMRNSRIQGTCLTRSLTTWWLLRRLGVTASLRLGGRRRDGAFQAHGLAGTQGRVINDSPDVAQHYAVFPRGTHRPGRAGS